MQTRLKVVRTSYTYYMFCTHSQHDYTILYYITRRTRLLFSDANVSNGYKNKKIKINRYLKMNRSKIILYCVGKKKKKKPNRSCAR